MASKAAGTKRGRRQYSEQERDEILTDARRLGVCEAARKHGVPQPTVSGWRRKAGKDDKSNGIARRGASEPPPKADDDTTRKPQSSKGDATRPARRYTPSEKARALEYAAEHGMSQASKDLGISRFALYDWKRKVAKAAEGHAESPTSGPAPSELEAQRDREILSEWRKHAGLGPSQVQNQLRRRGIKVGVATVRRVMEDAGYRPPKVQRDTHDERYESVRPNHRWHLF